MGIGFCTSESGDAQEGFLRKVGNEHVINS